MSTQYLDPIHLPIVPPMDLHRTMPGIDRISPFPMELRAARSIGLFGTRRGADNDNDPTTPDLIRMHEGVDLLAPRGTPVFAAATGTVLSGSPTSLLLRHDDGFHFLTYYQHLQNKKPFATGATVFAGQQVAEVGDWGNEDHLHFEIRYPFASANPSRDNSLPVDPTAALYQWEERTFQNDGAVRIVLDNVVIQSYEEVVRCRMLRFFMVNVSGSTRDLFIPLHTATPYTQAMIDTIQRACLGGKKVRIVWRESHFYKHIQTPQPRAAIIVEVKVYA